MVTSVQIYITIRLLLKYKERPPCFVVVLMETIFIFSTTYLCWIRLPGACIELMRPSAVGTTASSCTVFVSLHLLLALVVALCRFGDTNPRAITKGILPVGIPISKAVPSQHIRRDCRVQHTHVTNSNCTEEYGRWVGAHVRLKHHHHDHQVTQCSEWQGHDVVGEVDLRA